MTTLSFQPEADRYYAEGYWRPGDLWEDFAARAHAQPDKVALVLDDRRVTYDELRRAAVALSARLAAGSVQPGDVVVLLGRHSIEAAVAMLGCLHRGVVLAPLPPMFNVTQLAALARQTGARAIVGFGGEKEIAKCEQAAPIVEQLISLLPATLDELIAEDASDERGERGADDIAMVMHSSGTTSAPKGIVHSSNTLRYATEGICGRWGLGGDDVYLVATEFGFVGGMVFGYLPVLLNGGTGVLMSRWKPEEALRLIEEHRCTYVLLMPTHAADTLRGRAGHDARPLLDARARGAGPHAGAAARDAGRVRDPAAGRLRPLRGAGPRGARACRSRRRRCSRPRAARTTAPRSASSTATARRCPPARSATSSSTGRAGSCASSATTS